MLYSCTTRNNKLYQVSNISEGASGWSWTGFTIITRTGKFHCGTIINVSIIYKKKQEREGDMKKEDIEQKFSAIAETYDSQRKALIPCFEQFYNTIVEALPSGEKLKILDIGAGTGLLSHLVLEKHRDAELTLIDISGSMLQKAKERFGGYSPVSYIEADYATYSFTEKYDIVISSLSIHHLIDSEKEKLYKTIYTVLNNGGIFVNGDQFHARTPQREKENQQWWKRKIEATGISPKEIDKWEQRVKMDIPATVDKNIEWFEQAGFTEVELLFKMYNFGVITGRRSSI